MEHAFVTGSTGLYGTSLVTRLLSEGVRVTALVRADDDESARDRLIALLHRQSQIEGANLPSDLTDRLTVFSGEITDDGCLDRIVDHLTGSVDTIWHCAACVNFIDEPQCVAVNIEGTRNMIAMARRIRPTVFHHVSTAYVAGGHDGIIHEDVMPPRSCNNAYESTKYDAELFVRSQQDVPFVIHRPSIIVGSRRNGRIRDFKNFYLFIRFFARGARVGYNLPLRFPGTGDLGLNLVPLDWCIDAAWEISRRYEVGKTYHVVNADPPSLRRVLASMNRVLNTTCIEFAGDGAPLGDEEREAETRFREFLPYMFASPRFDLTNIRAIAPDLSPSTLDDDALDRIVEHYVEHGLKKRSQSGAESDSDARAPQAHV